MVVLVGFHDPIGVDIVRRDLNTEDLSAADMASLFSPLEREALSKCSRGREYDDLYSFNWAFKEAYMKFLGVPDWDNVASIEFLGIRCPSKKESCVTHAVDSVVVSGNAISGYTESHVIKDTYVIAIYTSSFPEEINTHFKIITLEEIVAPLSSI